MSQSLSKQVFLADRSPQSEGRGSKRIENFRLKSMVPFPLLTAWQHSLKMPLCGSDDSRTTTF